MKETFEKAIRNFRFSMLYPIFLLNQEAFHQLAKIINDEVGDEEIRFSDNTGYPGVMDRDDMCEYVITAIKSVYNKDKGLYELLITDTECEKWFNPLEEKCVIDIEELTDIIRIYFKKY